MALTKASYSMVDGAYVNVLDFGAVGDDTTDSWQAITNAIATKRAVFFPDGQYRVSKPIVLSNIGQRVFGAQRWEGGNNGVFIGQTSDFTGNATIEVTGGRNQVLENLTVYSNGATGVGGTNGSDAIRLTSAPSMCISNVMCKFGVAGIRHISGNLQRWWNIYCEANDYGYLIEPTSSSDCNGSSVVGCRAYASYIWGWDIRQGASTRGPMHNTFDISAETNENGIRIENGMYNFFNLYAEGSVFTNYENTATNANFVFVKNPDNDISANVGLLQPLTKNSGFYTSGTDMFFDGCWAPEKIVERDFAVSGSLLNNGVRAYNITNSSGSTRALTLGWLSYAPIGMRVTITKNDNTAGFSIVAPAGITLSGWTSNFGVSPTNFDQITVVKTSATTATITRTYG